MNFFLKENLRGHEMARNCLIHFPKMTHEFAISMVLMLDLLMESN